MNYLNYAKSLNANNEVLNWISHNLVNYLKENKEDQDEIEHIIDYLINDNAPYKLIKTSYEQAKIKAEKWTKKLQNKGEHIKETKKDTEVVLDFKDGFKIVKLISKNAYDREGFLMRHCVASYYGKDTEIYSLRDKNNMPHCTIEKDNQIKGKGNGDIHPKYIDYVVKFLEHIGMTVGDNEMAHLGYVNIEKLLDDIGNKNEIKKDIFNKKYFPKNKKELLKDNNGNVLNNLNMLDVFPLIEEQQNTIKIAFDIPLLVTASIEYIRKSIKKLTINNKLKSSGDNAQLAGGYNAQLAGGDNAKLAGGDNAKLVVGKGGIAVGDNKSIAKGKIGSCIVLCERDNNYNLVNAKAVIIDGKIIKEDVWYKLEKNQFIETTFNAND